jgi:hypothetical protein
LVWPSKVRRGTFKHAFEDALDEASLDADGNPILFDEDERVTGPMVGSLGDIPVAPGYVAQASLARAYEAEDEEDANSDPIAKPGEAARALKLTLDAKRHTAAELRKLRRRFAAANHPDRVDAGLREEALAAMADVNAAIDKELSKRAEDAQRRDG